ncbi:MAG TPA: SCO family protein [Mycobacteriales bacterium]|nr:SCO family protein [Mycobacteriales bacterium]
MIRRMLVGLCFAALAGASACASGSTPLAVVSGGVSAHGLRGDVLSPPTTEPPVVLADTVGTSFHLARETRGKVVLVYFGYTHCPDVCPTLMADVAQALRESSAAVRADVEVVFISVDPVRDTRSVIRRWLDHFDPDFVGLRGSIGRVIAIQKAMGVPVSKVTPHSRHGYSVAHSAELLAFTPDREAHVVYTDGPTTIGDLRHDLAVLTTDKAYGA